MATQRCIAEQAVTLAKALAVSKPEAAKELSVVAVTDGGRFIKTSDGNIWEVQPFGRNKALRWRIGDSVEISSDNSIRLRSDSHKYVGDKRNIPLSKFGVSLRLINIGSRANERRSAERLGSDRIAF